MRRILVLSYWNINRPVTGGLRRVEALVEALGPQAVLCQPEPAHPRVETVAYPNDWGRSGRGINRGLFNFFHPGTARRVRRAVRGLRPAAIGLTSIWAIAPIRRLRGIPVFLDAHDVLAVAMAERYGAGHPFTRAVRGWERMAARRADRVFACSEADRDRFLRLYGLPPGRVRVVPNGVRIPLRAGEGASAGLPGEWARFWSGACALFFMGNPRYAPNAGALRFLADRVLPELERIRPGGFRLVVCGGDAPPGTGHPSMRFAGAVPDDVLKAFLERADICLAPVFSGAGTRLKILEYLAAGRPVVATPKAAEGLEAVAGREYRSAGPDDFARAVSDLAAAPAEARAMGEAGRRFVRGRYGWASRIQPLWRAEIRALCGEPDEPRP